MGKTYNCGIMYLLSFNSHTIPPALYSKDKQFWGVYFGKAFQYTDKTEGKLQFESWMYHLLEYELLKHTDIQILVYI